MLSVIMMNVIMLSVIMLNVVMLGVVMLNVFMLSVAAPSVVDILHAYKNKTLSKESFLDLIFSKLILLKFQESILSFFFPC